MNKRQRQQAFVALLVAMTLYDLVLEEVYCPVHGRHHLKPDPRIQ